MKFTLSGTGFSKAPCNANLPQLPFSFWKLSCKVCIILLKVEKFTYIVIDWEQDAVGRHFTL